MAPVLKCWYQGYILDNLLLYIADRAGWRPCQHLTKLLHAGVESLLGYTDGGPIQTRAPLHAVARVRRVDGADGRALHASRDTALDSTPLRWSADGYGVLGLVLTYCRSFCGVFAQGWTPSVDMSTRLEVYGVLPPALQEHLRARKVPRAGSCADVCREQRWCLP